MEAEARIKTVTSVIVLLFVNLIPPGYISAHSNPSGNRKCIKAWVGVHRANQTDGVPRCDDKSGEANSRKEVEEVRFSYDPTDPTRESKDTSVHVILCGNGEAYALRYERTGSTVVATHKGVLPQAERVRLITRVQEAIKEASRAEVNSRIIRESDLFSLSIKFKGGAFEGVGGKVEDMTAGGRALVETLRVLWRRLEEVPPADGYLRSSVIEKERLAVLLEERRIRFTPLHEFPQDLQEILRRAVSLPADFHPLSVDRIERLRAYASYGEVFLTDKGAGYKLTFFLSERKPARPWTVTPASVTASWTTTRAGRG